MSKNTNEHYLEREVSWMYFNYRLLKEAQDENVPLFERLNFLGIYSNNLDVFFRVLPTTPNTSDNNRFVFHEINEFKPSFANYKRTVCFRFFCVF